MIIKRTKIFKYDKVSDSFVPDVTYYDTLSGELKTKNEIKKGKKDELKEKYSELTITTKEYQALRTQNDELKKEYYELGGK